MRLQGKTALVTGAASGFGKGIAEVFAREGARVAVVDLNAEGARAVAAELGDSAIAITCDVSKAKDIDRAVAETQAAFGSLDIVVNNAGWTNPNRPLMETDEATFRKIYDINVLSIFHMVKAVVPVWRASGGGVMINIGSTAGIRPRPGLTWYNSSKGAVNLMSRSLAAELAPDNIRVNCIAPGPVRTKLAMAVHAPEIIAAYYDAIPLNRYGEAREIAEGIVFLLSENASFVTGQTLAVDGGFDATGVGLPALRRVDEA